MSERPLLICMSTTTLPIPPSPSELRWCSLCSQQIWQSWDTMELDATIVCDQCAPGVLAAEGRTTLKMSRKVRERFRAEGMTDAEIDHMARFADKMIRRAR